MHFQTQNGVTKGHSGQKGGGEGGRDEFRTYRMAFPEKAEPRTCPFEGCSGRAAAHMDMLVHLWNRPICTTVVVLEEGTPPLTHVYPCVTFCCRCGLEIDSTSTQHITRKGRSVSDGVWRQRRKGQKTQGRSAPMFTPLIWYRLSSTWGEYYWQRMLTGKQ